MKYVFLAFIFCIILSGCSIDNSYQSNSVPQFIENLGTQINSEEQAQNIFTKWLNERTDFSNPNSIESINAKKDYYNITLSTSIKIDDRLDGIQGYKYYKLDSNGNLYGYYMSK